VEVYSNRYGTLFDDHVIAPDGTKGRYLRWHWAESGIVVVPFDGQAVAFTRSYRYPIGAESIELPRGSCSLLEKAEAAASRELSEETGLHSVSTQTMGEIFSETGMIENPIQVILAKVSCRIQGTGEPEPMESISRELLWITPLELDEYIKKGKIRCGISLAALMLLQSAKIFRY
jgi:ADP-ribose pyrophosphatase